MIHIRVTHGENVGEEIKTHKGMLTIGRSRECDLHFTDRKISQAHGEIFLLGTRCVYRDLNSRNGSIIRSGPQNIWLGPLMPEWNLKPGDEIVLGKTVIKLIAGGVTGRSITDNERLEETVGADIGADDDSSGIAPAPDEISRFSKLLGLRAFDPTDVMAAKRALCDAFHDAFPEARCVTFLELAQGHQGDLTAHSIDSESVSAWPPGHCPAFSAHVVRESYRKRGPVLFGTRPAEVFPGAESVVEGRMTSCMCAPLWKGETITGFVHLYTTDGEPPFMPRDAQLVSFLASIASLLINGARAGEEHSRLRTLASAGQIVAALEHDAGKILRTLGMTADKVESDHSVLADSFAWKELRKDMDFISRLVRDTMARIFDKDKLDLKAAAVQSTVENALAGCRRYFLEESDAELIKLENTCDAGHCALFDPTALTQALINCIKNSIDAIKGPETGVPRTRAWQNALTAKRGRRTGSVLVTSGDDLEQPQNYLTVSVCDDGCGISPQTLTRLAAGPLLVSTKGRAGAGLGLHSVVECIQRMHGRVRLASSTTDTGACPPGTIVSLCLAKADSSVLQAGPSPHAFDIVSDYGAYRSKILSHVKEEHL